MARGFTLVDTLIGITLAAVVVVTLAHLALMAVRANRQARLASWATIVAVEKIESLRSSRSWPARSPPDALSRNVPGACDFFDDNGRPVARGAESSATVVRRWLVAPLLGVPADAIVIHVLVAPIARPDAGGGGRPLLGEVRLVSVRTKT